MAINFPSSPTLNQISQVGSNYYIWDGAAWVGYSTVTSAGIATYATNAGIATNAQGLTGTPNLNVGIITATSFFGNGSGLTGIIGSGSGIVVKDSGSTVGTAGTIDFGDNLTVSAISAGIVTVTGSASGTADIVLDLTPQLGGNLDLNSKNITGIGTIDVTGDITGKGLKLSYNNPTSLSTPGTSGEIRKIDGSPFWYDGVEWREFFLINATAVTQVADTDWDKTILRCDFETNANDLRFGAIPTISGSAAVSSAQYKFGTKSLRVNSNSSDGIAFFGAQRPEYNLEGAWTIEGWYYFNALNFPPSGSSNGGSDLWSIINPNSGALIIGLSWDLTTSGSTISQRLLYVSGSSLGSIWSSSVAIGNAGSLSIQPQQWCHIAVQRSSNGLISIIVNGLRQGSYIDNSIIDISNEYIRIGQNFYSSATYPGGFIDDFRISTIARYSSTGNSSSPTTALPITGSTTTIIPTNSSNTFGISAETSTGTNAKLRLSKSNSTVDDILLVGAGGLTIARTDDSTITFTGSTSGGVSSQFVTTAAGIHTLSNVGIGTTNPTSKLTVSGDVLVSGVSTFRDYLDINNPSSSSSSLRLHNVSLLSAATNFTKLSANAAALAPEIGGGYAPLHLRSNSEITLQSVIDSFPVVYAGFTTTSSYLNYLGATKLQTLGTGITVTGTTFTNQLSVSGVVTATSFFGNGSGLTGVIGSGSGVIIKDSGSTVGTAGTIDFGDNLTVSAISAGIVTVTGSFQFVTTAAGIHTLSNVGIGTTNPTSALTVTGSISVDSGITIGRGGGSFPANIAIGPSALFYNTTGQRNTGVGWQALQSNTTGEDNVANGYRALFANTTGLANVAIGSSSLQNNTTGLGNVAVGTRALYTNTTGNFNTATGVSALFYNTTGNKNTANGNSALISNTTGNNNTATGVSALKSNTTGSDNVAIGGSSLYSNTTGIENTATGYLALFANTTGNNNTANGNSALQSNTTGSYNTGIGWQALESNITANSNTGIGYRSLFENRYGSQNVAIGMQSLFAVDGGSYNTATGNSALAFVVSGTNNTATGYAALNETTGSSNSGFGYLSGSLITTGSKNTILGSYTGNQNGLDIRTLNNNVVLSDGDGNIRFYANSSGNVGIGTTNPQGTLQVGTGITMYGSTGIISATTFVGNFSGSITNATNLTGGYANASQLNVSGVATISQGRIQADGSSNLRFGNIAAGSGSGRNIAIGDQVLYSLSGGQGRNIGIGELSYYDTTSGQYNIGLGIQAGQKITTGNYNVILGGYDGQTGLDLRTSSNNVVIADGQGNIRQYINSSGNVGIKTTVITEALTVAGIVSATSFYGTLNAGQLTGSLPAINGSALIGVVGSGSGVIIQGNGTPVGTAGTINFASNLNVTFASGIATVSGASSVSSATTAFNLAGSPNVTLGSVLAGVSTFNAGNVYITGGVNFESSFVNISGAGFVGWRRIGNLGQGQLELVSGTYLDPTRVSPLKIRSNTSIELGSIGVDGTTYVSDIAYAGFSSTSSYLNHNNSKKFETTGYGVSIYGGINAPTGIITASSFSGSGSGLTNLPAAQLTGTLPAIDGSALLNVTAAGTGIAIRDDNSNIGSATTVNFGTGLDVTFSAGIATITASGGSLQSRTTVSGVTTSIANNGIGNTNITGFKSYGLMKVGLSTAGWLRLYTDSTSRTNDISRSVGEDPAPGSGVIAEVVTTGITTTQIISPFVMGGNLDNSPTTTIYAAIKNLSGSTQAITANLTILQLEA